MSFGRQTVKITELIITLPLFPQKLATGDPHLRLLCVVASNLMFRLGNTKNRIHNIQVLVVFMRHREVNAVKGQITTVKIK
jgi:hypothetical protein